MTKKGYIYACKNIIYSSKILKKYVPKDCNVNLTKSIKYSIPYFGSENTFGKINKEVLSNFINWLYINKIETNKIKVDSLVFGGLSN